MKYLTNSRIVAGMSVAIVVASAVMSLLLRDWTWFGRSGSILTLAGAALATRRLLRMGVEQYYMDEHTIDGGHIEPTAEEIEAVRQGKLDVSAAHIGCWFIIIGTLIWGYGDLIQKTTLGRGGEENGQQDSKSRSAACSPYPQGL